MNLKGNLPDERLINRLERFSRMRGAYERGLAYYLLQFNQRKLYLNLGFSSTVQYAYSRLHIRPKTTMDLLRLARALEDLPRIDLALAKGQISWTAAREITRVAVKQTEDEWLKVAKGNSLRRVESAVSRVQHGERPPKDAYGVCKTKLKLMVELPMEDYAVFKAAFDRMAESAGEELDYSSAVYFLAKEYLERPMADEEREYRKPFQVVYHRCSDCDRAWIETSDGPEGVPAEKVDGREKEAKVVRLDEPPTSEGGGRAGGRVGTNGNGRSGRKGGVNGKSRAYVLHGEGILDISKETDKSPRGESLEGMSAEEASAEETSSNEASLDGIPLERKAPINGSGHLSIKINESPRGESLSLLPVPTGERDKPNSRTIRQSVLSRDGLRCAVPGCVNRGDLNAHHVTWLENGGKTETWNEVTVCRRCHTLLHEGFLNVEGTAPHGLTWTVWDGRSVESYMSESTEKLQLFNKETFKVYPRGETESDYRDTVLCLRGESYSQEAYEMREEETRRFFEMGKGMAVEEST